MDILVARLQRGSGPKLGTKTRPGFEYQGRRNRTEARLARPGGLRRQQNNGIPKVSPGPPARMFLRPDPLTAFIVVCDQQGSRHVGAESTLGLKG